MLWGGCIFCFLECSHSVMMRKRRKELSVHRRIRGVCTKHIIQYLTCRHAIWKLNFRNQWAPSCLLNISCSVYMYLFYKRVKYWNPGFFSYLLWWSTCMYSACSPCQLSRGAWLSCNSYEQSCLYRYICVCSTVHTSTCMPTDMKS